jgi:AraC-like DNA-binding protein
MLAVFRKRPEIALFGKTDRPARRMLDPVISLLDLVLRSAGVSLALVLLAVTGAGGGWRRHPQLLAVVGCAAAYVVCAAPALPCCASPTALPLMLGAIGFPFAFWCLARVVLQDERGVAPSPWAWLGLAVLMAGGVVAGADYLELPLQWRLAGAAANKLAALLFVGAALFAAWRSWEGDLVEPRRRLRWVLVGYLGLYGLVVMGAEVYLLGRRPPPWIDALNVLAIDLSLFATLAYLLAPRTLALETLFAPVAGGPAAAPPPAGPAGDSPAWDGLLERLRSLMEVDTLYRDPELSVSGLAARLGVADYLLRRLIHDRLGHRNFAAFVNGYRLREVARRLADPGLDRRPVLTLALEAGFGSIGPFNRQFREAYGLTPTEFRARRRQPAAVAALRVLP